jgi:hypothetical protein
VHLGALFPATTPIPLIGRSNLTVCQMDGFDYDIGDDGSGVLIIGSPSRTINPVTVLGNDVCVDTVAAEGFCAAAAPFTGMNENYTFCQDRLTGNFDCVAAGAPNACCTGAGTGTCDALSEVVADDCGGTATGVGEDENEECYCDLGGGVADLSNPCGAASPPCPLAESCGVTKNGTPCFPGTLVSSVELGSAGSTTVGDCVILNSTQFTTVSASNRGADLTSCTNDDTAPPPAVATTPFTTGSSSATLADAFLGAAGNCTTNTNHLCIEDGNCTTTGGADTCVGQTIGTLSAGPLSGTPLGSVLNFETSNVSGLKIVGAFPAAGGTLGDLATEFSITCD